MEQWVVTLLLLGLLAIIGDKPKNTSSTRYLINTAEAERFRAEDDYQLTLLLKAFRNGHYYWSEEKDRF